MTPDFMQAKQPSDSSTQRFTVLGIRVSPTSLAVDLSDVMAVTRKLAPVSLELASFLMLIGMQRRVGMQLRGGECLSSPSCSIMLSLFEVYFEEERVSTNMNEFDRC